MVLLDSLDRPLHDLRISVTDRCNLRCTYCMPKEIYNKNYKYLEKSEILSFEEIYNIAKIFYSLGVKKIRITGGEPLLRNNLPDLISLLNEMDDLDLAVTTNGILLKKQALALYRAGLKRVTVSLDSVEESTFKILSDSPYSYSDVLEGIEAAISTGIKVKVNSVIKKNINDDQILQTVDYFRNTDVVLRFIEYMDVGNSNKWLHDEVVPSMMLQEKINEKYPIKKLSKNYSSEVAERFKLQDGSLELGFISSVTKPFCSECSRIRLSSDGKLYTCLFGLIGTDIKNKLRAGQNFSEIAEFITDIWNKRNDRYSELRSEMPMNNKKVEMPYIGG
ncbi:MAG: GTP 3',8-cyclase MoaA [Dehalococcoidia bacterium]|nr:GTP 3',8-cyclase MoaA [Dehalococcoidia bacterium]